MTDEKREWIIQRCINAWTNQYENWPEYLDPMTESEALDALKKCEAKYPYEFRAHNITHSR